MPALSRRPRAMTATNDPGREVVHPSTSGPQPAMEAAEHTPSWFDEAVAGASVFEDYGHLPLTTRGGFVQAALDALGDPRSVRDVLQEARFEEPITRAQVAAVSGRLLGWGVALRGAPALFGDVPLSHWAAPAIYRAREEGVIAGFADDTFRPEAALDPAHAAVVLRRLATPGARAPFDRDAARAREDASRRGDDDANGALDQRIYSSLAQYEGGDPRLVHYDSDRVNLGKGSWTGGHVVVLMDLYAQVARENDLLDDLYGPFGGRGAYDALRERFARDGVATRLAPEEEEAFRLIGGHPILAEAQDRKGAGDVDRYVNQIRAFPQPWPWLAPDGSIAERSVVVLCHAAHQAGSAWRVVQTVLGRFGGASDAVRGNTTELDFLRGIRDRVVEMVQPRYQVGVRNRYNRLLETFDTQHRYFLGEAPAATVLRGQVLDREGAPLAGVAARVIGEDGFTWTCKTNAHGFFDCARGLAGGTWRVEVGGAAAVEVALETGRTGWAQVTVDDADAAREGLQGPGAQDVAWAEVLAGQAALRRGDRGDGVRALQERLNRAGQWLVVDGAFGDRTARAVETFQRAWRIRADGVVGPQTATRLDQVTRTAAPDVGAPSETRTYTVRPGDTLWDIAQRELGRGGRYLEIARLNGLSDPGRIRPGQHLQLPR